MRIKPIGGKDHLERGALDLAVVAYSGPPSERATRVGTYSLKYFGLSERFASIASFTSERELLALPIVEIESLPGQPSAIRDDADAFAIALGDWKRGYTIVDRQGMRQVRDIYTDKPRVLFYTTKRVGGAVVNFEAIKFLRFSA